MKQKQFLYCNTCERIGSFVITPEARFSERARLYEETHEQISPDCSGSPAVLFLKYALRDGGVPGWAALELEKEMLRIEEEGHEQS